MTSIFRILPAGGVYTLIILVEPSDDIAVSKLGWFTFQKGYYAYTGSAMNNLRKRVERHTRKKKIKHWHIDFLLDSDCVNVESVIASGSKHNDECRTNMATMAIGGTSTLVPGFGASDCKQGCKSHLTYFGDRNPEKEILNAYRTLFKFNVALAAAQASGT